MSYSNTSDLFLHYVQIDETACCPISNGFQPDLVGRDALLLAIWGMSTSEACCTYGKQHESDGDVYQGHQRTG